MFTNLEADDIDLGRTNARGVRAQKTYLAYCQQGTLEIPVENAGEGVNPFENAVASALRDKGYDIRHQVGTAGYFIDLTVVDPAKPGRFLLGIETDGASYHSARSVRDRDRPATAGPGGPGLEDSPHLEHRLVSAATERATVGGEGYRASQKE